MPPKPPPRTGGGKEARGRERVDADAAERAEGRGQGQRAARSTFAQGEHVDPDQAASSHATNSTNFAAANNVGRAVSSTGQSGGRESSPQRAASSTGQTPNQGGIYTKAPAFEKAPNHYDSTTSPLEAARDQYTRGPLAKAGQARQIDYNKIELDPKFEAQVDARFHELLKEANRNNHDDDGDVNHKELRQQAFDQVAERFGDQPVTRLNEEYAKLPLEARFDARLHEIHKQLMDQYERENHDDDSDYEQAIEDISFEATRRAVAEFDLQDVRPQNPKAGAVTGFEARLNEIHQELMDKFEEIGKSREQINLELADIRKEASRRALEEFRPEDLHKDTQNFETKAGENRSGKVEQLKVEVDGKKNRVKEAIKRNPKKFGALIFGLFIFLGGSIGALSWYFTRGKRAAPKAKGLDKNTGRVLDPVTVTIAELFETANPDAKVQLSGPDPKSVFTLGVGTWTTDGLTVTFKPDAAFNYSPVSVKFTLVVPETANEFGAQSEEATISLKFTAKALTAQPVSLQNLTRGKQDIPIAKDATNPDEQTVKLVEPYDVAVWSVNGFTVTFTPAATFDYSPISVNYKLHTAETDSAPAAISLSFVGVTGETLTAQNVPLTDQVRGVVTIPIPKDPANTKTQSVVLLGTLAVPGKGQWSVSGLTVTFTPATGFDYSPISISYNLTTGTATSQAIISLSFQPPTTMVMQPPPTLSFYGNYNKPVTIHVNQATGVTGKVVFTDNSAMKMVPNEGTWSISGGDLKFTANMKFTGASVSVDYKIEFGPGSFSNVAKMKIVFNKPIAAAVMKDTRFVEQGIAADANVVALASSPAHTNDPNVDTVNPTSIDPKSVVILGFMMMDPESTPPAGSMELRGKALIATGQGTWLVSETDGSIWFAPEKGYTGNPTPIYYTLADNQGNRADAKSVVFLYNMSLDPSAILISDDDKFWGLFKRLVINHMPPLSNQEVAGQLQLQKNVLDTVVDKVPRPIGSTDYEVAKSIYINGNYTALALFNACIKVPVGMPGNTGPFHPLFWDRYYRLDLMIDLLQQHIDNKI